MDHPKNRNAPGSTVNVASRVQELTRTHQVDILVTEAARAALDPRLRLRVMPAAEVKGVSGALTTFASDVSRDIPRRDRTRSSGLGFGRKS